MKRIGIAMCTLVAAAALAQQPETAELTTQPATAPATGSLPSSDWFGTTAGRNISMFEQLYPNLAKADPAIRSTMPRTLFNSMTLKNQPPLQLPVMRMSYHPFTDATLTVNRRSAVRDPWMLVLDERKVRIAAWEVQQRGEAGLCFDIEEYPLDPRSATDSEIDRATRIMAQAVAWARSQNPGIRVFMYSMAPITEVGLPYERRVAATTQPAGEKYGWWVANKPRFEQLYQDWAKANARLRSNPDRPIALADLFDGVCPSLYIHSTPADVDPLPVVQAYIWQNLDEARKYGKPIYPFIWTRYYDRRVDGRGRDDVPLKIWVTAIREIMKHADGAILWDEHNATWTLATGLRVRAATILAERRGEITDRELYNELKADFGMFEELQELIDNTPKQTR